MKQTNFSTRHVALLKQLGFVATFREDCDLIYCEYALNVRVHSMMRELKIIVDGKVIEVYSQETGIASRSQKDVLILSWIFTVSKLLAVIEFLTTQFGFRLN